MFVWVAMVGELWGKIKKNHEEPVMDPKRSLKGFLAEIHDVGKSAGCRGVLHAC